MIFQEGGNGTFWMTPQERVGTKFSHYDDMPLKYNIKDELLGNLESAGVYMTVVKGKRVGELQDIYREKLISVTNIIRKKRVKGWMVKPKEIIQELWEYGFMDTPKDLCTYYTLRGREDNYGNTII